MLPDREVTCSILRGRVPVSVVQREELGKPVPPEAPYSACFLFGPDASQVKFVAFPGRLTYFKMNTTHPDARVTGQKYWRLTLMWYCAKKLNISPS